MKSWTYGVLVVTMCYARANARSVVVEHAFGPEAEVRWDWENVHIVFAVS